MKKHLILIFALSILFASGSIIITAQDEIKVNANAPADYDANLAPGTMAVAIWSLSIETVQIVSKSGGVYTVKEQSSPNKNVLYIKANSVYPYFNWLNLMGLVDEYSRAISPCVSWYSAKTNIPEEVFSGTGTGFYIGHSNAKELKERLEESLPRLAELESRLASEVEAFPETYTQYRYNPALVKAVAVGRSECSQWVLDKKNSLKFEESTWLMAHRDGIAKTLKAVNDYDPATMTSMNSDSEYALYAVSPKARTKWLTDTKALDFKEPVDKLLAPLEKALAGKLPTYFSSMDKYSLGTAADFALLKRALTSPARYKIFKTGLMQNSWQIVTNSLGIPTSRYKNGVIYLRDTNADHPYCHATYVNIIQDYAGGGRYAASRSRLVGDELVGCPAGTK